jgi:hypothetical protein
MIEIEFVVAAAMGITNIIKDKVAPAVVPIVTVAVAVTLNMLNAHFGGGDVVEAAKAAFVVGGAASGLFVAGSAVRKSIQGESLFERK